MDEQLGAMTLFSLKCTSIAAPSQWEGELGDGRSIYIRYRHGRGAVQIGDTVAEAYQGAIILAFDRDSSLDGADPFGAVSSDEERRHDSYLSTDELLVRLSAAGMTVDNARIISASE